jgi:hypothetical protein
LEVVFWRGRKNLERGRSFIKIRKGFGGVIISNFKVPINWRILEG